MPSAITWIATGSGNWDTPGNWSGGAVPGSGDDVSISTSAPATITITSIDTESVHSLTTAANDTLSMTGGSLAVAANSTLSGALSVTGGTLAANGTGTVLSATGSTSIDAASLYAEGGTTLSLPNLSSYTGVAANYTSTTLEATGAGSTLDLSNLTSFSSNPSNNDGIAVNALAGGHVKISSLTAATGNIAFDANGAGSVLNLSQLASFSASGGEVSQGIQATSSGQILDADLTSLNDVYLTLDGTGTFSSSQITALTDSDFNLSGGSPSFASLSNLNASTVIVSGAATWPCRL